MPELGLAQTVSALEARYPAITENYEKFTELNAGTQHRQEPALIQQDATKPESK